MTVLSQRPFTWPWCVIIPFEHFQDEHALFELILAVASTVFLAVAVKAESFD